jgi:hypothetical protein
VVILSDDAGGVADGNAIWGNIFCYDAAGGDHRMPADGHSRYHDGVCSNPAIVFNPYQVCGAFLIADRRLDVGVAVVHCEDADVLGKDDVVADLYGADDHVADSDDGAAADDHVAHAVIDGGEVFDNGAIAHDEFAEGYYVEAGPAADNYAFTFLVYEGVDEQPHPPAGPMSAGQ